jgi:hypothetical protein
LPELISIRTACDRLISSHLTVNELWEGSLVDVDV